MADCLPSVGPAKEGRMGMAPQRRIRLHRAFFLRRAWFAMDGGRHSSHASHASYLHMPSGRQGRLKRGFPSWNFGHSCGYFSQISTKSVEIVSAWNRGFSRILPVFASNHHKSLSMNNLQLISGFASQTWSKPVKVNQGKKILFSTRRNDHELPNPYQYGRDSESRWQRHFHAA